jgi:ZIP family zinc transporter
VVAPLADENRTSRPSLWHFGALGLLAGAPVVFGGWIGSAAVSPTLGALFLAIGVGAIAQVVIDLLGMIRQRGDLSSIPVLLGLLAGLLVMYATGLLVAL